MPSPATPSPGGDLGPDPGARGDAPPPAPRYPPPSARCSPAPHGLQIDDRGTLILTGANSYTGGTTIADGTLQIGNGGTSGAILGDVVNAGALVFNRADAVTFAGAISGTGSLTQAGSGTLTLSGANSFTGATTVAGGTLALMGGAALADGARLTVNAGATVSLVDAGETVGSIAGAGTLALGSQSLTVGGDGTSATFSGAVTGSGTLVKIGAAAP